MNPIRYQHCSNFLKTLSSRGSQVWEVGLMVGNTDSFEFTSHQKEVLYSSNADPWMMFCWLKLYQWNLFPKSYLQDVLDDEDPAWWQEASKDEVTYLMNLHTCGENAILEVAEFLDLLAVMEKETDYISSLEQQQIDKEMKCYAEVLFRNAPFLTINEDTLKEMFLEE